jgi:hypothetical protein
MVGSHCPGPAQHLRDEEIQGHSKRSDRQTLRSRQIFSIGIRSGCQGEHQAGVRKKNKHSRKTAFSSPIGVALFDHDLQKWSLGGQNLGMARLRQFWAGERVRVEHMHITIIHTNANLWRTSGIACEAAIGLKLLSWWRGRESSRDFQIKASLGTARNGGRNKVLCSTIEVSALCFFQRGL